MELKKKKKKKDTRKIGSKEYEKRNKENRK